MVATSPPRCSPCEALLLEKLAHQLQGRRFVAAALRDDVERLFFVIHRAPAVRTLP
jgi:hypothetical protein